VITTGDEPPALDQAAPPCGEIGLLVIVERQVEVDAVLGEHHEPARGDRRRCPRAGLALRGRAGPPSARSRRRRSDFARLGWTPAPGWATGRGPSRAHRSRILPCGTRYPGHEVARGTGTVHIRCQPQRSSRTGTGSSPARAMNPRVDRAALRHSFSTMPGGRPVVRDVAQNGSSAGAPPARRRRPAMAAGLAMTTTNVSRFVFPARRGRTRPSRPSRSRASLPPRKASLAGDTSVSINVTCDLRAHSTQCVRDDSVSRSAPGGRGGGGPA